MHGIGDHGDWDPLGSPGLAYKGDGLSPDVALPPALPVHQLRLVNWSRTSRRVAGLLWYLEVPFALANVAGHMRLPVNQESSPRARRTRRLQTFAVGVTSVTLTGVAFVWLVAIAETTARALFPGWAGTRIAEYGPLIVVASVLVAGLVFRSRLRPEVVTSKSLLWLHGLVIVGLAGLSAFLRPNHLRASPDGWMTAFVTYGPAEKAVPGRPSIGISCSPAFPDLQLVRGYFDPVTTTAVFSVALVALVSGLLVVASAWLRRVDGSTATIGSAASGMTLLASVLVLNGFAAALRLALDNLGAYLDRHQLTFTGGHHAKSEFSGSLLPYIEHHCAPKDDYAIDLIPLIGLTALIALVIGMVCASWPASRAGNPVLLARSRGDGADRARWVHKLIATIPESLPAALLIAFGVWLVLLGFIAVPLLFGHALMVYQWGVVFVQASSLAIAGVALAGRSLTRTRAVLGSLGDIIGFWPVTWHPLGGASYRDRVVAGIRSELTLERSGTRVLVGHSQGSVLAAWAIAAGGASAPIPAEHLALVTCGSPLKSLYGVFFPEYFDAQFFADIDARTCAWANFWRDTDPIATTLPSGDQETNRQLLDPPTDGWPRAHGDYWIAQEQQAFIREQIGPQDDRLTSGSVVESNAAPRIRGGAATS